MGVCILLPPFSVMHAPGSELVTSGSGTWVARWQRTKHRCSTLTTCTCAVVFACVTLCAADSGLSHGAASPVCGRGGVARDVGPGRSSATTWYAPAQARRFPAWAWQRRRATFGSDAGRAAVDGPGCTVPARDAGAAWADDASRARHDDAATGLGRPSTGHGRHCRHVPAHEPPPSTSA